MKKVKKAVILAGGFGTRFLPFTKGISKVMLPIIDKPTIQLICEEAIDSGIEEICIIVGINKESIINHFIKNERLENRLCDKPEFLEQIAVPTNMKVTFIEQTVINGTAGATLLAKDWVNNEPFLLMYADDLIYNKKPVSKQVIEVYEKYGKSVMAVQNVSKELITKYSSVEYYKQENNCYFVSKITEKPKMEEIKSTFSSLGRFVFTPKIFELCENVAPSKNNERYLTDAIDQLAKVEGVVAFDFDGIHYDTGNKFAYLKTLIDYAIRDEKFGKDFVEYIKKIVN